MLTVILTPEHKASVFTRLSLALAGKFKIEMFNPREEEINFDSFINFPLFCFKLDLHEFAPLKADPTVRERIRHYARMSVGVFCLFAFILVDLQMLLFSFLTAEDFLTASGNIPLVVMGISIHHRQFVSVVYRNDLWNIFEDLRAVFATHEAANSKYKIREYLDGYHLHIKIYATFIVSIFLPMMIPTVNYILFGARELSINYWYPFDPLSPFNFPFALAWVDFFAWTYLSYLLSADALLYALITVLAMEFDILKADILELRHAPKDEKMKKVQSYVDRHNKLFDITDKLQDIFGVMFLFSFVMSSLVMCYVAFIIATANELATYAFYVPFMLIIGGQTLLLCMYGQKISDSSLDVADGVFCCSWEDMYDKKLTKQLVLMIARAQRPKQLSAMGFIEVTLANFTSVSSNL